MLEVVLGFCIVLVLVVLAHFLYSYIQFSRFRQELATTSSNFLLSNQSISEAIISLGTLLDDLDEVSGELVRPPAMGDVLAQLMQMWGMSKIQQWMPEQGGLLGGIINSHVEPDPNYGETETQIP